MQEDSIVKSTDDVVLKSVPREMSSIGVAEGNFNVGCVCKIYGLGTLVSVGDKGKEPQEGRHQIDPVGDK
jgi:hypothetical protein